MPGEEHLSMAFRDVGERAKGRERRGRYWGKKTGSSAPIRNAETMLIQRLVAAAVAVFAVAAASLLLLLL